MEMSEHFFGSFASPLPAGEPTRERAEAAEEIPFDELDDDDLLLMQTQHSLYNFSIADSALRRGLLTGGYLGEVATMALLIGIKGEEPDNMTIYRSKLLLGARAIFVVAAKDGSP